MKQHGAPCRHPSPSGTGRRRSRPGAAGLLRLHSLFSGDSYEGSFSQDRLEALGDCPTAEPCRRVSPRPSPCAHAFLIMERMRQEQCSADQLTASERGSVGRSPSTGKGGVPGDSIALPILKVICKVVPWSPMALRASAKNRTADGARWSKLFGPGLARRQLFFPFAEGSVARRGQGEGQGQRPARRRAGLYLGRHPGDRGGRE